MGDLALGDGPAGFRLDALELYNWGTFHRAVWRFPVGGRNTLVTGEIGSGKSTLVDAITTLLFPHQRITYNKAAGAERRERTIRGYILGEYKSSRDEETAHARPVCLRQEDAYSVILAVFRDSRGGRLLSLAHLYWIRAGEVQRIHVVSGRRLSVLEDFASFDGDGAGFRKRLRAAAATEIFDTFADYSSSFRAVMGLTEKALELFYQTVSMKSVGDLDDFVRSQMLERAPVAERIAGLLRNYDNLRTAHDAVQRTRLKREALRPIAEEGREHLSVGASIEELRGTIDSLPWYVQELSVPLLSAEVDRLRMSLADVAAEVDQTDALLQTEREREGRLAAAIEGSEVGRRIADLGREMERLVEERDRRRERMGRYDQLAKALGYEPPVEEAAFRENHRRAEADQRAAEEERAGAVRARDEVQAELRTRRQAAELIASELESLRSRTSSIPARNQALRSVLLAALEVSEEELPFAGELIRVQDTERAWEGAAERVLRNLGLSLLVPEGLYRRVSDFVRRTDLRDRLVYFRVPEQCPAPRRPAERSLLRVLEVKNDSPLRNWIETELLRRYDYTRCATMEEFYRENDAVTREGLLKLGKVRHEKDDRPSTADPRHFILGWSNREKIGLLEKDLAGEQAAVHQLARRLASTDADLRKNEARRANLARLSMFASFDELDWRSMVARHEEARAERDRLERTSDGLSQMRASLAASRKELARLGECRDLLMRRSGSLENELDRRTERLESAGRNLAALDQGIREHLFPVMAAFIGEERPDLAALDGGWQEEVKRRLESRRESLLRKEREIRSSFIKRAQEFLSRFPETGTDLLASVDFIQDFAALLAKIERDDLPTHEERFRGLLRESTLNDIALFQQQLENDSAEIRSSVEEINRSLRHVEYNPGTFIMLSADRRDDQEVRDFRADLRRCLENTLLDEELYSETKFLQVKKLLDRFAGEETADRSWTDHVTDVRTWFTFTASERYSEDGTEKEYYSSSSGKSGGQKEKLAYTILASALSHQYGMGGRRGIGGFRLVVIDEAFGRGSEESTRYGLDLFATLDLQLLIVTPLQKLSVIEGYVSSVHFITNSDGRLSEARSLTIEEYRAQKCERRG